MILGIGIDLIDIRRMERDFPYYKRVFTPAEQAECEGREERMAAYAKRFAAKEACIKALGANDAIGGAYNHEVEIGKTVSGRPTVTLHGGAARQLTAITPSGYKPRVEVTITDDFPVAAAMVLIHAEPSP